MKKQLNKAAQALGRLSAAKRVKGLSKKQISEYYSKLSVKNKKRSVGDNEEGETRRALIKK